MHDADSLYLDSHGTLWAAFRNHGLAHYDGAHWHVEDSSTGLPSVQIRRLAETVDEEGHSAAVEACQIPIPGEAGTIQVTISAGVASTIIGERDDTHHLLRDADMAMYQAKHDGRNLVRTRQQARTASPESEQT